LINGLDFVLLGNRGVEVTSRIAAEETDWKELFLPSDFFSTYPRYLQIDIIAEDPTDHRLWHGWCESRLRQLVVALEQPNYCYSHPFTKCYSRITDHLDGVSSTVTDSATDGEDAQSPNGSKRYFVTTFFVGLSFPPALKRINLSRSLQDFLLRVNAWERRKPTMDLRIIPLKQSDIPDFVFQSHSANSTLLEGQSSRYFRALGEERHFGDCMPGNSSTSSSASNSGNSEDDDNSAWPTPKNEQQANSSSHDSETFMVGDVQIKSSPRPSVILEPHQVSPVDAGNAATATITASATSSSNGASENGAEKENGHHAAWPALQQANMECFDSPSKRPRVVDEPRSSPSAGEDDQEPGMR
jgi:hypothetical protein